MSGAPAGLWLVSSFEAESLDANRRGRLSDAQRRGRWSRVSGPAAFVGVLAIAVGAVLDGIWTRSGHYADFGNVVIGFVVIAGLVGLAALELRLIARIWNDLNRGMVDRVEGLFETWRRWTKGGYDTYIDIGPPSGTLAQIIVLLTPWRSTWRGGRTYPIKSAMFDLMPRTGQCRLYVLPMSRRVVNFEAMPDAAAPGAAAIR